ncbi:hypothetical protein ACIBL5_31905 [Streptomyces sp. NPDC050516]|uniref:hypothetical protein n=1 Tax=Streptomyces sp. NPDC050516 TaxID=3365621 RepID=UPI0037983098
MLMSVQGQRARRRPNALLDDMAYDSKAVRREQRKRRIMQAISRKGAPKIKGLGKLRYVVEQTFALRNQSNASPSGGNGTSNSTTPSLRWPAA